MLYKIGTMLKHEGGSYDYIIVEHAEVKDYLAKGWSNGPEDCHIDAVSAPTRSELEEKAKELNITFNGRTSDKTLSTKIKEALNVVD